MSQENVAAVERLCAYWAREELPGPIDLLDPDVQYVNPDGAIEPGTRDGIEAFTAAVEKLREAWLSWHMYPERFVPIADKAAVVVRSRAQARASGIAVDGRESALLTLRDGKIVRYEWFHGPEDAFKAAGMDP